MKKLGLVILFSLGFVNLFSQQSDCACPVDDAYGMWLQAGLMGLEYRNPVEGYKGKHYYSIWALGEIALADGDLIKGMYLQYDQYMDELLWLRKTDRRTGILPKDIISGFRLYNSRDEIMATFEKRKVNLPFIGLKDAYLQVLAPGDPAFYAWRNSYIMASDNRLVENSRYLIISGGKDYPVRLSRKSLLNLPLINKTEMKAILRTDRIRPNNNEEEFARAISRYNQSRK